MYSLHHEIYEFLVVQWLPDVLITAACDIPRAKQIRRCTSYWQKLRDKRRLFCEFVDADRLRFWM